ncbi:MAG: hypothetical protein WC665_02940 [Sulfurimonas sp.]
MKTTKIVALGFTVLFITFLVSGCTNKAPQLPNIYYEKEANIPKLDTVTTIEVGESIYVKLGNMSYAVKMDEPAEVLKSSGNDYDYNPAWLLLGPLAPVATAGAGLMYMNGDTATTATATSFGPLYLRKWNNWTAACNEKARCIVDAYNQNKFTHSTKYPNENLIELEHPIQYSKVPTFSPNPSINTFKYQAIYEGKSGTKIKISFNEFTNDMSRPTFTQDVEYELDNNDTALVGFKGLRIEVLKATNLDMTYKIVQDYN